MLTGRVIEVQRVHLSVALETGETVLATVRGDFHETGEYPKVGDMVQVTLVTASEEAQAVIELILPRTSAISRLDQETQQPQIIVTNVDTVFIVMGLDGDYNINRLERYLLLARQSSIAPVVILNKADMAPDLETQTAAVHAAAGDTPVHVVTATTGEGLEVFALYFTKNETAVLLGSSGAGKSTITNWLLGHSAQETQHVRVDDSRGRHTTTTRQLFTLPDGGYLIDTPGMRELGLVEAESTADDGIISQIEQLALDCTFSNCDHDKSAGCAVQAALLDERVSPDTLANYHKLVRERAWLADKSGNKNRFKEARAIRTAQARSVNERRRLQGR